MGRRATIAVVAALVAVAAVGIGLGGAAELLPGWDRSGPAVERLTGAPAAVLGVAERGPRRVAPGPVGPFLVVLAALLVWRTPGPNVLAPVLVPRSRRGGTAPVATPRGPPAS